MIVNGVEVDDGSHPTQVSYKGKRWACEGNADKSDFQDETGLKQVSFLQDENGLAIFDNQGKKILKCQKVD